MTNEATREAASDASGDLRPPYIEAAIAGALVFALYAITLSRTTAFWDTSEYIATGHIMGIPHPPGTRCSWCSPVRGPSCSRLWDFRSPCA